ncbi:MAG: hypothetical protein H6536_03735 [Bacteroidales bacterium]|nr:hypothetical protein [Bacteroidales bacterium]
MLKKKPVDHIIFLMVFLSPLLFRLFLDISYFTQTVKYYGYLGYVVDTTSFHYVISWLFLVPFLFFHILLCRRYSFSSVVAILFLFVSVIPNTSLYAFVPISGRYFFLFFIFWVIFYSLLLRFPDFFTSKNVRVPFFFPFLLFLLVVFIILFISGRYTGFRFWINIYDVYSIRWDQETWNLPLVFNYVIMAASVILPFFFVLFISQRRWVLSCFVFFIVFLNYGIGGQKSVLFSLFSTVLGYLFFSFERTKYFGILFTFIPIVSCLEPIIIGSRNIHVLAIQRGFYIPARITQASYDFFSTHELDLYRQKFMRRFGFDSPYDMSIERILSGLYFNDYQSSANNGLFSDAYSNLGVIGVLIIPVVLVIILKLFDLCSASINAKLFFGVIVSCFIALFSMSFSIALLSNGLIIMMLVLYSVGFSSSPAFKGRLLFISKIIKTSK